VSNNSEHVAGFGWRHKNRSANAGNLLRDIAVALAVALVVMLALLAADAQAQHRTIQISGNSRTAMVTVIAGRSQDVRIDGTPSTPATHPQK